MITISAISLSTPQGLLLLPSLSPEASSERLLDSWHFPGKQPRLAEHFLLEQSLCS